MCSASGLAAACVVNVSVLVLVLVLVDLLLGKWLPKGRRSVAVLVDHTKAPKTCTSLVSCGAPRMQVPQPTGPSSQ